jgi:cation diffusion facilitator CzcD-associated flavoprotein CzcO
LLWGAADQHLVCPPSHYDSGLQVYEFSRTGLQFLETLCEDNVDVVTDKIERFTEKGIKTVDGVEREFDVIICATGFSTSFIPHFPIIGKDGIDMRDQWADIAEAYLFVLCLHPSLPK